MCVCSSILCIPVWGAFGECVCPVSWLHQSKCLPAAVPLPGLSLWEQLFVHSTGSLRLPLLQTWSQHWFQITSLWMWWVFGFWVAFIHTVLRLKCITQNGHRLKLCYIHGLGICVCFRNQKNEFEKLNCLRGTVYKMCITLCVCVYRSGVSWRHAVPLLCVVLRAVLSCSV